MNKKNLLATLSIAGLSLSMLSGVAANADSMKDMHMSHEAMSSKKMPKKHAMHMSKKSSKKMHHKSSMMMGMKMDGLEMNMKSKLPKGLKKAKHTKFRVGQKVTLKAKHMKGMYNAKAKVAGVYKTNLYEITFKPTNGKKTVKDHKWVVSKELKAKGKLKAGKKVTVLADHMYGMKGAKGKIVKVHKGPAYVVNFTDTKTHMVIKNHKWLTQSELKARK